jgi:murein DD-endopeptidase MepM/ murein hydrolase activator NlpD
MVLIHPPIRSDPAGDGHYGAPRGDRKHTGIDFAVAPGSEILAPENGIMCRYGYAYSSDLTWRIVDLRGAGGQLYRFFYCVQADFSSGDRIEQGDVIAVAQDITQRYPGRGMKPHVHVEVLDQNERHLNPAIAITKLS